MARNTEAVKTDAVCLRDEVEQIKRRIPDVSIWI
jgi:hypothetical protein